MREDRRSRQLARIEEMRRRSEERLQAQLTRIDKRYDHARRRIMANGGYPSDDQQRIISAALELLNEVGLEELSLRKLAGKLNMKAPALYWHFENKRVLMDYMAEEILHEKFPDMPEPGDGQSWQEWFVSVIKDVRAALLTYRDGGLVAAGVNPQRAKTYARLGAHLLTVLCTHYGMDFSEAGTLVPTTLLYTYGSVIEEQNSPSLEDLQKTGLSVENYFPQDMRRRIAEVTKGLTQTPDFFEQALELIIRGVA